MRFWRKGIIVHRWEGRGTTAWGAERGLKIHVIQSLILIMGKPRLREGEHLAQYHTACYHQR